MPKLCIVLISLQPADWPSGFGFLVSTYPLIATEFGDYVCNANGYYNSFVNYCATNGISWTGWGWYPQGCGFPSLITDWNGILCIYGQ